MDLTDALRTTGAIRTFRDEPVPDDLLYDVLDTARFAPSGGNRQAWRVVVLRDPATRRALRDLYLDAWHDYVAHTLAGLVPFSPTAEPAARAAAAARREEAVALSRPDGFAETLDAAPALLVVTADLSALAATDRDLDRYSIVGGASVYPFVWSVLLAARERGLGGVMTTVATRHEAALRDLLAVPAGHAVAAVVVLGYPVARPTHLRRRAVEEFATIDAFDGAALTR